MAARKKSAKLADPRAGTVVQVRLSPEQREAAEALASSEGCSLSDLARRGLLGHERSELAAWRAGRDAGLREAQAAIRALPPAPDVQILECSVHEPLTDAVHPGPGPGPSATERAAMRVVAALHASGLPTGSGIPGLSAEEARELHAELERERYAEAWSARPTAPATPPVEVLPGGVHGPEPTLKLKTDAHRERPGADWHLHLCEANAMALRGLLGFRGSYGRVDLAAARAAIVRAARDLEQIDAFLPCGGRVGIEYHREGRHVVGELTLDGLRARFLRLNDLIERGADAGGVALVWS